MNTGAKPSSLPFFVYGTLLAGQPNHALWLDDIRERTPAVLHNAALYDCLYYPVLIEQANSRVVGELVWVREGAHTAVLNRLDTLEGYDEQNPSESAYQRSERTAVTADGSASRAWVYMGRSVLALHLNEIPGGDWLAYLSAQQDRSSNRLRDLFDAAANRHRSQDRST